MAIGIDILPEYLLDPEKRDEAFEWLIAMPVDNVLKKQLLAEWCKYVGVALTEDMVQSVIGYRVDDYLRG